MTAKVLAQRPTTGMWVSTNISLSVTKKWQVHNDVSYRTLGSSIAPLQYLYRTGVRYNFNKEASTAAGFAFFATRNGFLKSYDEFGKEFRLWQEFTYRKNLTSAFQLFFRLRTEQRNFEATSDKAAHHTFRYRLRLQLQQQLNNHFALQVVDEYMQQHEKGHWYFDQNRVITNIIYAINPETNFSFGYMWLRWPASSNQHILNIGFQKNILLYAK
jgi:hypothetical protein